MTRRDFLITVIAAAYVMGCAARRENATKPPAVKPTAVTLAISGMTWQGCVEPVRSALLSVRGVQRADVVFERHEAVVEYDPSQCTVNDLISAVANAKESTMPIRFAATVKK